ncbi:hypothetical protein ABMA28_015422 [Loxostege sticticalis]|uniref:Endonuclease/exonuclease/phosphatase domain-containing protein n=1 Tax=Loxostege sticticalis TaxID=481309 RepID=A0ABD0TAG3_LOXSC
MDSNRISKIITYNCKNIKRSVDCVRDLCQNADVVALQETWLLPHDLTFLGCIHRDFSYTGKSAVDLSTGVLRGRPHGGVAILWRNSVFRDVSVIQCKSERIAAIKVVTHGFREILFMCVYMPTDQPDHLPIFTQCLGELNAILEVSNIESVFMLGNFNAHPLAPFCNEMLSFCDEQQWVCADIVKLGISSGTFTYVSEAHGCKRWLDHCLVSSSAWRAVVDAQVLYDVSWSDHFPLIVECNLGLITGKVKINNNQCNDIVWGSRNPKQIAEYQEYCKSHLKLIDFPDDFRECADGMCGCIEHRKIINNLYQNIVDVLSRASKNTGQRNARGNCRHRCVKGWNKRVADAHKQARLDFQMYVLYGRPESGPDFENMILSRKIFKSRLKYCQRNQEQILLDIIAAQHSTKQFGKFWKSTKKLNSKARACQRGW